MDLDVEAQGIEAPEFSSDDLELTNDIFTVSVLQIALRAEARRLHTLLNEAGANADTTTPEGLFALLQQVATLLLDYSRYWTHVLAQSQTVNGIEDAEHVYNQLLQREQSKFSPEDSRNGAIANQPANSNSFENPAYTVLTLLFGTADDQPLFGEIFSASVLRDSLDDIRMMQPRYMLVFEMLWSPQDIHASFSEEELTAKYNDLVAIA
ncbi:MAG: DUF1517 domain-containing protein [Oscillatoriales cyanobacterium C42_A2020_001]|nr:DUF1517 domain-containing protein [Leptolyngbyaceae cyanobacterium C42_A2020_001]